MTEAVGAPLLSIWLPLLFTVDLRRGLCWLWEHMLLNHTQSPLTHTRIQTALGSIHPALMGDYRSAGHNHMLAICFTLA